jgi:choline dehydrogenase-like flavoprotein
VSAAPRPTGDEAYRDGTGTFHPLERRIVEGAVIAGERVVQADACVIGAGAGGAVAAKELAEGGMRVVMLEEGEWHDTDEFTARPRDMTLRLYRDAAQTATLGTPPIVMPLGQAVGGTTLVNSGTCFRTPAPVLELWRERFGLEELTEPALEAFFRRVERTLNVAQVPAELAGRNADVVRRGAEALGWSGDFLFRNVRGCVGSGVCAFGCPAGAKQHVGITYVPRAWAAGATTYTGTRAERIELEHGPHAPAPAPAGSGRRVR